MVKKTYFLFSSIFFLFLFLNFASAWEFNGTIRDVDGISLNNTLVNITFWTMGGTGPTLMGSNSTTSNASGWFSLDVFENSSYMYQPVIRHRNATTDAIDYTGQSLPQFPYAEFSQISDINFYLKPAGTINITAINRTGGRITFRYQVKDTKLGYQIAGEFNNAVDEAIIYLPRDRNYSVMIYPDQAMPVSFNWNNFTSASSYNIVAGLSKYNATTHTVQKTFNSTDNLIRLTGYIQNSSGSDFADWSEFTLVPFLLEPGNMIYLGDNAGMPYNMSAWNNGESDIYNLTSGFYNITLPGTAESTTYMLFATARNGTSYYGGYKNISLSYSDSSTQLNLTMYSLMSTNWGSASGNISLSDAASGGRVNISSARQQFNLINSSNSPLSDVNAHLEIKVDYTNYGAREFTFMTDISSGAASFYLPLLNAPVKEMNVFSQSYSPKRVGTKTAAQVLANPNITMSTFNPGDIDGHDIMASVQVALYQSNSTCNLPNPESACIIADSASMDPSAANSFNPMSSIIGGGKLNFRMGLLTSGIIVEYINVDMLASGPPDALFDDSATTSTSGNFDSAMRFGSNGPTIYDYVIISMPYTAGSSSVTGLNESADVNMSIPILYDENWNIIWNATANGTSGNALAGNQTHYSTYSSQWQILMGQNNCTKNQSEFNLTNPCYMDTTNNRIWIRLPHFSGTQPSVSGSVVSSTTSSTPSTDSSSNGGDVSSATESEINAGYSKTFSLGEVFSFTINGEKHKMIILKIVNQSVGLQFSSITIKVTMANGEEKKIDLNNNSYYDLLVKINSITGKNVSMTVKAINESTSAVETANEDEVNEDVTTPISGADVDKDSKTYWWIVIVIAIVLVIIIAGVIYWFVKKRRPY